MLFELYEHHLSLGNESMHWNFVSVCIVFKKTYGTMFADVTASISEFC